MQESALIQGANDYVIKKMNDMNMRSDYLRLGQDDFYLKLKNEGFYEAGNFTLGKLLYSRKPSSYFMKQKRNAIVVGKSIPSFVMFFPWAVEGNNKNIKDVKAADFKDYNMIIFIEPGINNVWEESYFEELVRDLAKQGKTIFIEMGRSFFHLHYWVFLLLIIKEVRIQIL